MRKLYLILAALVFVVTALCVLPAMPGGGCVAQAATKAPSTVKPKGITRSASWFTNWTGLRGSERMHTDVFDVRGWDRVAIQWKGRCVRYTNYSTAAGATAGKAFASFGNYSSIAGSFTIYVSDSPTGPWSPLYLGTTKLTYTADGGVTFDNTHKYVAVSWTPTRGAVNASITVSESK